jgi:hypothetical protein
MLSPQAEALVSLIRSEIQSYGQSVMGCEALFVLVADTDPIGVQFGHIFAIASRERWSAEFRNDGTVRFADLETMDDRALHWPQPESDLPRAAEA